MLGLPVGVVLARGFTELVGLLVGLAVALALAEAVGLGVALPIAPAGCVNEIGISKPKAKHALTVVQFMSGYFQLGKASASRHFHLIQVNLFI